MATINLIPNKKKTNPEYKSKADNIIHSTIYNTNTWKKLRINYLMLHPVCEKCNNSLAIEVHHKTEISTGKNKIEMQQLGFDSTNLMALCPDCHKKIHNKNFKLC